MSYLPSKPDATLIDVFKKYPDLARPLHAFADAVMRGPSPFSAGERELIAAYVSKVNGCDYCERSHGAVTERFGIDRGVIEQLVDNVDAADVPDRLKPALHFVRKLNDAPSSVTRADVEAILAEGWDESAVVHAALVCGHFNLMNRWIDGLGIEADSGTIRTTAEHLHKHGYSGILELLGDERPSTH